MSNLLHRLSFGSMTNALLMCFLIFAVGDTLNAQQSYKVWLASGVFTPSANVNAHSAQSHAALTHEEYKGKYVRLVQFDQIPNQRAQAEITQMGAEMLGYVDFGAYFMRVPVGFDWTALRQYGLRSIEPVRAEWRVAKRLMEQPYPMWAYDGTELQVIVSFQRGVTVDEGARLLRAAGVKFKQTLPNPALVYARLRPEQVLEVAALPYVSYVEPVPPAGSVEDDKGRALHRANLVDSESAIGPKFTGAGISVLTRDDGAVGPHIDFQGRLNNIATEYGPTHGDGVSGIFAGAGNLDPDKRGMAAGAELYVLDYVNNFQDETLPLHLNEGVKVTNSSYSDGCNVGYTAATVTVDNQIFENPTLMHVFSAGNSNGSNCDYGAGGQWGNITGGHKQAKNAIATANLNQLGVLEGTSSRGPAYDGRIKPDIAANGAGHLSTDEQNTYLTFGGTSGAAPGIAGIIAQLMEAYKTINNGQEAPSALIKATLLNTANDMGHPGPDYKFGWGHVHAGRALKLLQEQRHAKGSITQGEEKTFDILVPQFATDVRVMVYWVEPEADQQAAKALINDLDITLSSTAGGVVMPYRLDPTAVVAILDTPAGLGRDSLNNMEQVFISNPTSGNTYTLTIKGTAVPMGPAEYYIVYDYVTKPVQLTYPNGGEGLYPGKNIHVQWDATPGTEPFTLTYSTDAGATWLPLATPAASARLFAWTIPAGISSGQMMVSVTRFGQTDQSDTTFTIMPQVTGFKVDKICPDSVTVSWAQHATATGYDVFLLGNKYMEVVGSSATNSLTFYKPASFNEMWLSVRPLLGTAAGRRIDAIQSQAQLLNCPQAIDYTVATLISPSGGGVLSCDPNGKIVKVRVQNVGLNPAGALSVSYQIDQQPPVTEFIADLLPNESVQYSFTQQLQFPNNGVYQLRTWVNAPGDLVYFNDTISTQVVTIDQLQTGYFTQDFEGNFPPAGYRISNPDGGLTWEQAPFVIGLSGGISRAAFVNHFDYEERGEEDQIFMIPIDLTGLNKATLAFDLAHSGYDATYSDGLRVTVHRGCTLANTPDQLYEAFSPALNTTAPTTSAFIPDDASDWRRVQFNMDDYVNDKIIVVFTAINDFGNNTYLDNINLSSDVIALPVASITATADTACRILDTLTFSTLGVAGVNYTWNFGSAAQPTTTATGPGPHLRYYLSAGDKIVRLVASNQGGNDTAFQIVNLQQPATAVFTSAINQNTVTFTNTSIGTHFLWDFGDGNTSTLRNPVHTYATTGNYPVKMESSNTCRTQTALASVVIQTISTNEALADAGISIAPNPNQGRFDVQMRRATASDVQMRLLTLDGRLVRSQQITHPGGDQQMVVRFDESGLPAASYLLEVVTESGVVQGIVVVQ